MSLGEVVCYNIYIDGKTLEPIVIFHTEYFSCRIDHKRNLNNIDKKELYKWVEKIQKINRDAGMFLAMCYEKYKKIDDIVNDDEYDKQHSDFTNEYEDCIVVVKNYKN